MEEIIFIFKDVVFNENKFPYKDLQCQRQNHDSENTYLAPHNPTLPLSFCRPSQSTIHTQPKDLLQPP